MSEPARLIRRPMRVSLMTTHRTDVLCVSCGNFGAERVIVRRDDSETDAGVHVKCAQEIER
jgi:hypothetical protein